MTMRGILGIVMMLISMHVFAGIANDGTQDEEPVNVKLDIGDYSICYTDMLGTIYVVYHTIDQWEPKE